MKSRVCLSLFIPPSKGEACGLGRGAEVKSEFVEQGLGLWRFFQSRKIVEYIL